MINEVGGDRGAPPVTRRVAAVLKAMGFDVRSRVSLRGSSAKHQVEMLATVTCSGRTLAWVIACHPGPDVVMKDRVLELHRIAEDTEACGAVLVAESGWHPNAMRAAEQTRTILTSSELLESALGAELDDVRTRRLLEVIETLCLRIDRLWPWTASESFTAGIPHGDLLAPAVRVMELKQLVAPRLAEAIFPLTVLAGDETVEAATLSEAERALDTAYAAIEDILDTLESRVVAAERAAIAAVESLTARSHELFSVAEVMDGAELTAERRAWFVSAVAGFDRELAVANQLVPEGTPSRTLRLARFVVDKIASMSDDHLDRDYFMLSLLFERTLRALFDSEIGVAAAPAVKASHRTRRAVAG